MCYTNDFDLNNIEKSILVPTGSPVKTDWINYRNYDLPKVSTTLIQVTGVLSSYPAGGYVLDIDSSELL